MAEKLKIIPGPISIDPIEPEREIKPISPIIPGPISIEAEPSEPVGAFEQIPGPISIPADPTQAQIGRVRAKTSFKEPLLGAGRAFIKAQETVGRVVKGGFTDLKNFALAFPRLGFAGVRFVSDWFKSGQNARKLSFDIAKARREGRSGEAAILEVRLKKEAENLSKPFMPGTVYEGILRPVGKHYKEAYGSPEKILNYMQDHPLEFASDIAGVATIIGGVAKVGLKGAAKVAGAAGKPAAAFQLRRAAVPARRLVQVGKVADPFLMSQNVLLRHGIQKPILKLMDWVENTTTAVGAARQAGQKVGRLRGAVAAIGGSRREIVGARFAKEVTEGARTAFILKRNKLVAEFGDIFKGLKPNEKAVWAEVVQGVAAVPQNPSKAFLRSLKKGREFIVKYEDELVKTGKLKAAGAEDIRFQPGRELTGLSTPELKSEFGKIFARDKLTALTERKAGVSGKLSDIKKQMAALSKDKVLGTGKIDVLKAQAKDLRKAQKGIKVDYRRLATNPAQAADDIMDSIRAGQETVAPGKLLHPVYFPHLKKGEAIKYSDFFISSDLQHVTPAGLKKRAGKLALGDYIMDPQEALARRYVGLEKFKNTEQLIDKITQTFAEPITHPSQLKPGWKLYTPDKFKQWYRAQFKAHDIFVKELIKNGGEVGESLAKTVESMWPDLTELANVERGMTKTFAAKRRIQYYQVPPYVKDKIGGYFKGTSHAQRIFWDKPLEAWRTAVLPLRMGWLTNNFMGNMVFGVTSGTGAFDYLRGLKKKYLAILPDELTMGGFSKTIGRQSKLGAAKEFRTLGMPVGKIAEGISNLPPIKGAGKIADTFTEFNSKIEDFSRNALYIKGARGIAKRDIYKRTGKLFYSGKEIMDELVDIKKKPLRFNEAIDFTNKFLNDYSKMSDFGRRYLRKFGLPFFSFYKHSVGLMSKYPLTDPLKYKTIMRLADATKDTLENDPHYKILPDRMKHWIPTGNYKLGRDGKAKMLYINTKAANPFSVLDTFEPGGALGLEMLNPVFKTAIELGTGRKLFGKGARFTDPDVVDVGGKQFKRAEKEERDAMLSFARKAPAEETIVRPWLQQTLRAFPQYKLMEDLIHPYIKYDTSFPLPGMAQARRTFKGEKIEVPRMQTMLGFLGIPTRFIDQIALEKMERTKDVKVRKAMAIQDARRIRDEQKEYLEDLYAR